MPFKGLTTEFIVEKVEWSRKSWRASAKRCATIRNRDAILRNSLTFLMVLNWLRRDASTVTRFWFWTLSRLARTKLSAKNGRIRRMRSILWNFWIDEKRFERSVFLQTVQQVSQWGIGVEQSITIYRKLLAVAKSNYAPCFAHNEQVDSFQIRNGDFRIAFSDCLRKDID